MIFPVIDPKSNEKISSETLKNILMNLNVYIAIKFLREKKMS